MLTLIDPDNPHFPKLNPSNLPQDGLIAASEIITPNMVQAAYRNGLFPWLKAHGYWLWFTQHPRAVIFPNQLHIGRNLRKALRQQCYQVSVNRAFDDVIRACSTVPRAGQNGTWINHDIIQTYGALHQQGNAHSFECWYPDHAGSLHLAGGFYGVQIGRVFYGESMFCQHDNASKIAFAHAVPYLRDCGIALIDCQQDTDHMRRFGSQLLSIDQYCRLLLDLNDQPLNQSIQAINIAQN